MAQTESIKEITVATNGTLSYQPTISDPFLIYIVKGSGTLSSSATVVITGSDINPKKAIIIYRGTFTLNGNDFTIGTTKLTSGEASSGSTIFFCDKPYNGTWSYLPFDSNEVSPTGVDGVKLTTLTGAGGTITLVPNVDKKTQVFTGNGQTLSAGWDINFGGVPVESDSFRVVYLGNLTPTGGNTVTIDSQALTNPQVENGDITIDAQYNGSSWTRTQFSQNPNTAPIGQRIILLINIRFVESVGTINLKIPIAYANGCTFIGAQRTVISALTTDNATVAFGNSGFAFANGTDTITTAMTINTQGGVVPTGNTHLNSGQYLSIDYTKATDSGAVFYAIDLSLD